MRIVFHSETVEEALEVSTAHSFLGSEATFLTRDELKKSGFLRSIVADPTTDILCLVDGHAVLPVNARNRIAELKLELDRGWPSWGVVGESGVTPVNYGMGAQPFIQFAADRSGGPNSAGYIVPSFGLSGIVMMINAERIRDGTLDEEQLLFPIGVTLPVRCLNRGHSVLIAPHLACFVDVERVVSPEGSADLPAEVSDYLGRSLRNHRFPTCHGVVNLPVAASADSVSNRIDAPLASLEAGINPESPRSIEIVTRTRYERIPELQRLLDTVSALASKCEDVSISHTIVSRSRPPVALRTSKQVRFLVSEKVWESPDFDDRATLVHFAGQESNSDLIWFVDDDDWVLPGCAEALSLVIRSSPPGSTFYFDVQQFTSRRNSKREPTRPFEELDVGPRVPGSSFAANVSGLNHIPFCAVLFDRTQLAEIPAEFLESLVLYEDLAVQLLVMMSSKFFPVSLDLLVAGVHLRSGINGQPKEDRSSWNSSMSMLVSQIVMLRKAASFLSIPAASSLWFEMEHPEMLEEFRTATEKALSLQLALDTARHEISNLTSEVTVSVDGHESALAQIEMMRRSLSWRITRPFRAFRRLLFRRTDL